MRNNNNTWKAIDMSEKYSQKPSKLYSLIIVCSVESQGKWNSEGNLRGKLLCGITIVS